MTATATSMNTTLSQWLRLLWDMAPPLRLDSEVPCIASGVIHLPARGDWRHITAATAHAAAHLVYSPRAFDGAGLGVIARALTALLEDARVEALAIRELPGLARLWQPLHTATPALGAGFEALLQRLARALADPGYDDPDRWVRKGRALFYMDAGLRLLALRTPFEVRKAATLLAHDIGQMRVQFNAVGYRPAPAYRDDHRWMWPADVLAAATLPATLASSRFDAQGDSRPELALAERVTLHPEWDRLISRLRPDWCRVIERPAAAAARTTDTDDVVRQLGHHVRGSLRALTTRAAGAPCRSDGGEVLDPVALVEWRVARRLRQAPEARLYRGLDRRARRAAVWLLIDQSASTATAQEESGRSTLETAVGAAAALALALQTAGVRCAIVGFHSLGRHAINLSTVKAMTQPLDELVLGRLRMLRPGGSTRLGAALRHAASRLAAWRGDGARWVFVLSDGEPHDVDVHDPRYLVEDARRAVHHAARLAVQMACLAIEPRLGANSRRIFGGHRVQSLHDWHQLPRAVQRILG